MSDKWRNDAQKFPDEVMNYIRELAVQSIVERGYHPDLVGNVLGISRSSLDAWLKTCEDGGHDAPDTHATPDAQPQTTPSMDHWLESVILNEHPTTYGYDADFWNCRMLAEILEKTFDVKVTAAALDAHLKALNLSCQPPKILARKRNPGDLDRFLNAKYKIVQRLAKKIGADIAFEDEPGVVFIERSCASRGVIEKTPKAAMGEQREKATLLPTITKTIKPFHNQKDPETYIAFLEEILRDRDCPLILFADHSGVHQSR